jgi:hypothetical protein
MLFRVIVLFRFELKSWGTNLQRLESQFSKSSYITKIYTLKREMIKSLDDIKSKYFNKLIFIKLKDDEKDKKKS